MAGSPLLYKVLVMGTLLVGVLSLLGNLLPYVQRKMKRRRAEGEPRESLALVRTVSGREAVRKTDAQWKDVLSANEYRVARQGGPEQAYTGRYWNRYDAGIYQCVGCGQDLFDSDSKYDAGTGWPSFSQTVAADLVVEIKNISGGVVRTEVVCSHCESHLGHVFADGSRPGGLRYCIKSASLVLQKERESHTESAS